MKKNPSFHFRNRNYRELSLFTFRDLKWSLCAFRVQNVPQYKVTLGKKGPL